MEADDSADGHDGSEGQARDLPTASDAPLDGRPGVIHLSAGPGGESDPTSTGGAPRAAAADPAGEGSADDEAEQPGDDPEADPDDGPEDEAGDDEASEGEQAGESASSPAPGAQAARPAPTPAVIDPAVAERLKRHHVAPALVSLDRVDADDTFRLREDGDLSLLATDIARLGQLFPVDLRLKPPDRFQVICGFRRLAALRFLQRDKVLARLHTDLSDGDALLMSLAAGIHGSQVTREELEAARDRLEREGRLEPAGRDMLEKALAEGDSLAPEGVEEEVDAEELADDVTGRLGEINQDLSLLADAFGALDEARKAELIKQLKYSADLVAFLEGQ